MKRKPSGLYGPEGLLFAGERRLWFPCGGRFYIGPVRGGANARGRAMALPYKPESILWPNGKLQTP